MKITARDVAKRAEASVSAVSRAFRPGSPISDETRRRILRVADELNYQVPSGQSTTTNLGGTIALIVSDLNNPFYPNVVQELSGELQRTGRRLVFHVAPTTSAMGTVMDQLTEYRAEGVIATSVVSSYPIVEICRTRGIPLVMVNRTLPDQEVNAVCCDNYAGGRAVAHRILRTERRKIAFVKGLTNTSTHLDRERGFFDVLQEAGLPPAISIPGEFDYDVAFRNVLDAIAVKSNRPDVIFCANDIMALASIDAILRMGLRVFDDISVIGFDDIPMAAWESYRLTTVRQPIRAMVRETVDLIEKLSADPSLTGITRTVLGRMIERESG